MKIFIKANILLISLVLVSFGLSGCAGKTEYDSNVGMDDNVSAAISQQNAANASIPPENVTAVPSESAMLPPPLRPTPKEQEFINLVNNKKLFTLDDSTVLSTANYICKVNGMKVPAEQIQIYVQAMLSLKQAEHPLSEQVVKEFISLTKSNYC